MLYSYLSFHVLYVIYYFLIFYTCFYLFFVYYFILSLEFALFYNHESLFGPKQSLRFSVLILFLF